MPHSVASAVAALLLGQTPEEATPVEADPQQQVVDELKGVQAQQQAGNEQLRSIAEGTQAIAERTEATREQVEALRVDQAQARAEQAILAHQMAAVVALLHQADALLIAGSFEADWPLAQAEALLSQMRGAEAASARARVLGGRLSLAQRNFVYARNDVFWAVAITADALK